MTHQLEAPGDDNAPDWDSLYRARGDEVTQHRPVFTGDVYFDIQIAGEGGPKNVIVLQHPCAIRKDGVTLMPKLLVGEVLGDSPLPPSEWAGGFYTQLPLAELQPVARPRHGRAFFDKHQLMTPEELAAGRRVCCLSQVGVNLLMQRWVNHNTRVVIPTFEYQRMSAPQFEEADLVEDWCIDREDDGVHIPDASRELDEWLSSRNEGGVSRRELLNEEQQRSQVRQELRAYLRELRKT